MARALRGAGAGAVSTITDERPFLPRLPRPRRDASRAELSEPMLLLLAFPGSFDVVARAPCHGAVAWPRHPGRPRRGMIAIQDRQRTTAWTWRGQPLPHEGQHRSPLGRCRNSSTPTCTVYTSPRSSGSIRRRNSTFRLGTDETLNRPTATPAEQDVHCGLLRHLHTAPRCGAHRAGRPHSRAARHAGAVRARGARPDPPSNPLARRGARRALDRVHREPPARRARRGARWGRACASVSSGPRPRPAGWCPTRRPMGPTSGQARVTADTSAVRELLAHGRDAWPDSTGAPDGDRRCPAPSSRPTPAELRARFLARQAAAPSSSSPRARPRGGDRTHRERRHQPLPRC